MSTDRSSDRARDYLRLVFTQIPGALWATDRDLRLTFVHGRTPMLDEKTAERLVGQTIYDFVGSTDLHNALVDTNQALPAPVSRSPTTAAAAPSKS